MSGLPRSLFLTGFPRNISSRLYGNISFACTGIGHKCTTHAQIITVEVRQVNILQNKTNQVSQNLAGTLNDNVAYALSVGIMSDYQNQVASPMPPTLIIQRLASPTPCRRSSSYHPSLGDKLSHYISSRFKDGSSIFSGAPGDCWNGYLSDYLYAAKDFSLTPTKKSFRTCTI